MTAPVVVCGLGKVGRRIVELLRIARIPVVAIDMEDPARKIPAPDVRTIQGDFRDPTVLKSAGVLEARAVLIVTSDDLINLTTALTTRRLNRRVRLVVRMFNPQLFDRLGPVAQNLHSLSVSALTAPLLAYTALTGEVLGNFNHAGKPKQVGRLRITSSSSLVGRSIAVIAADYKVQAVSHQRPPESATFLAGVNLQERLKVGDELVVCGSPDHLPTLHALASGENDDLLDVQWAGSIRRLGRVAWRFIREIDRMLKLSAIVLLTVVLFSTAIYALSGMAKSVPDGLYRTVSVIATGADMKADQYIGWQKTFVSFLRIFGAVLTASFTAIVTNYLLRARLGGALEIRRIPDSGHIVVCGLGHVGLRVVEELLAHDMQVVVVERTRDNPFNESCRRLGAAVLIGDGTVAETLREARITTARALVAVTSADLTNLEIVLLAREHNPNLRAVLRLGDDALAETLRDLGDVRLSLSLPSLAAPAFVAAMYGNRVHGVFRINRRLIAALEFTADHDGTTLSELTSDLNLMPIEEPDSNRILNTGDAITGLIAVSDMDRLFRREAELDRAANPPAV